MTYIDGDTYEGEWKCDEHHGKGKYTFPPPSCAYYDGELVEGNANGYGVKVWEDGSKYTGEWKHNMYHGTGTKLDPDGVVRVA